MPQFPRRHYSTRLSRQLRKNLTPEEARLWVVLRSDFREKFRRQEPMGPYIVDFVCFEHRLIVEVDGIQHADSASDVERDAYLGGLGFRVLRVWNGDVMYHLDEVTDAIEGALDDERRVARPTHRFDPELGMTRAPSRSRPPPSAPQTAPTPPPQGEE